MPATQSRSSSDVWKSSLPLYCFPREGRVDPAAESGRNGVLDKVVHFRDLSVRTCVLEEIGGQSMKKKVGLSRQEYRSGGGWGGVGGGGGQGAAARSQSVGQGDVGGNLLTPRDPRDPAAPPTAQRHSQ